jgi:hypothetical protein
VILAQYAHVVQKRLRHLVQLHESGSIGLAVSDFDCHGQIVSLINAVEQADHSSVVAAISTYADNKFWIRVTIEDATVEYGVDDSDVG